jgi:hypothetical protein
MKGATTLVQWIARLTGLVLIILGICFWTGRALGLIPLHMLIGLVFVIALWVLAGLGMKSKVGSAPVIGAVIWGIVVLALGMTQRSLLVGSLHWIVSALHLVVGLAAMGTAERLAERIKGTIVTAP